MISSQRLCHGATIDMLGHSLWLQCDLIVTILSLSSRFRLTKKGGLVDLHGIWTLKSELWDCESALLSLSHVYYPIKCIDIAACCRTHPKIEQLLDKA